MARVFTITEGLENMGALKTGGQGSVYKGRRTGEIFSAVKILPTPIYSESINDKHYSDFINEVNKLKKVNEVPNPNVVKIIRSGITETGSFPFIEMEYIEGPDLEELLKSPHPSIFSVSEAIKVAQQLSNALAHCHKVGVRHGDVKSNNVKFNEHSGNYVLLDFGLAIMSDEERRTSLRRAGAIEFMAPEQSEGKLLFQSDVYSFGIILYELLAGRVPYPLKDQGETSRNLVMIAHMEAPLPDLLALRRENMPGDWDEEKKLRAAQVPSWMISMIRKCLEKKPEARFANGVELQQHIEVNSTGAESGHEKETIRILREQNAMLLQENKRLQQQFSTTQPLTAIDPKPRKGARAGLVAAIITAVICGLIYFLVFRDSATYDKPNANVPVNTVIPEQPKNVIGQYKVVAPRAYFYNNPDPTTKRAAFMIPSNDIVSALDDQNGFIYTEYTNSRQQTSKGWLRKQDLATLQDWNQNNQLQQTAKASQQDITTQLQQARNLLENNQVKDAVYIYSYLSDQKVPEAMYQYGNLALQNQVSDMDCQRAIELIQQANDSGYIPAKRTLGFLYVFADNKDVLQASNYSRCSYEKDVFKGTQLLIQASHAGDSTARKLLEDIEGLKKQDDATQ